MTPPRLAERWLRAVIADDHARAGVIGDLGEEHARIARRWSRVAAHAWYWVVAATTAGWYLRERWRRRSGTGGSGPRVRGRDNVRNVWDDFRFAGRSLRRTPTFSAVAALTIALGMGSSTAIFSVLDGVVLQPLPYDHADRVVRIGHTAPARGIDRLGATNGMYFHYRENATTLDDFALYVEQSVPADGEDGAVEVGIIITTPSLFSILGVTPILGRLFTEEEIEPGVADVAVLSHHYWKTHYGGDSTVIGRALSDNGTVPIVGVLPEWFDFIRPEASVTFGNSFDRPDIFIPLTLNRATARIGNFMYQAVGLLAPGASAEDASRELTTLMYQMPRIFPENGLTDAMLAEGRFAAFVEPLKHSIIGDIGQVLWILMGAVGFVLFIALVNVLNLFVVRAESRRREFAVRTALGASGGRLARSFLAEAVVLAAVGGVLGVALAGVGTGALLRLAPPEIPRLDQVGIDVRVLAFAGGVALMLAIILGLLPAGRYARLHLATVLGDESRGTTGGRARQRTRQTLVVAQVAFALVLLVGSGLLLRTFWNLKHVRSGFGGSDVLTVRVTLDGGNVNSPRQRTDYLLELTERLEGLAGIEAASFAADLPVDGVVYSAEIATQDAPPEPGVQAPMAMRNFMGPGYLRAIGADLLQGREFQRRDFAGDLDVVVVNRAFAEQRWPGENPIGKRLVQWSAEAGTWYRVVGVVADIREASLTAEPEPTVYLPTVFLPGSRYAMFPTNFAVVLEISGDPLSVLPAVRREIADMGSLVPVTAVQTLDQLMAASMQQLSFATVLLVTAGSAALLLGLVGIYGVVAYLVSQRTREIGVRIALGAQAAQVRSLVLRQGASVGLVGVACGLVGGVAAGRVLQSLLFGVAPLDPLTYATASLLLVGLVLLATLLPARRAAAVDPMEALRAE